MDRVFEGEIARWVERSRNSFGFIRYDSGASIDHVWFSEDGIIPDNVFRTSHARQAGNDVRFRIVKSSYRDAPSCKAVEIVPIFPTDVPDPEKHREISRVERVGKAHVILRRKSGDQLYLHQRDVVDEFRPRWAALHEGSKVYHGVCGPGEKCATPHAVLVEIFGEGE